MKIKVGPAGKLSLEKTPHQVWRGDDPGILQFSRFAG